MVKKIVETQMKPIPVKNNARKPKPKSKKKEKASEPEPEEERPTTGGKTPATLEIIKEQVKAAKKPPSEAQLAARQRAKDKREADKKLLEEAIQKAKDDERKKEEEAAARKAVQAEKRRLKREGKKAEQILEQKPIDQTPPSKVEIKKYEPPEPERQQFKPASFTQVKRVGVWTSTAPAKSRRL